MEKQILYTEQAVKFLSKIPQNDAEKIIGKIEQYAQYPQELKNQVKKLQGVARAYRLRVGDYRVIFDETGVILNILKIGNRGEVYKGV